MQTLYLVWKIAFILGFLLMLYKYQWRWFWGGMLDNNPMQCANFTLDRSKTHEMVHRIWAMLFKAPCSVTGASCDLGSFGLKDHTQKPVCSVIQIMRMFPYNSWIFLLTYFYIGQLTMSCCIYLPIHLEGFPYFKQCLSLMPCSSWE